MNDQTKSTLTFKDLPVETQDLIRKVQKKHLISNQYHESYFGNTPPINGVKAFGRMMVAVGSKIFHANHPQYDWETPSDFLISYLKDVLNISWLENEMKKDNNDRHEIAKWFYKAIPNLNTQSASFWEVPNGKALALLHLAYDIFVLESVGQMPDRIIDRLKNPNGFNGARYEIFVFATLIRAGFNLKYNDEKSGLNGRVAECVATHHLTKEEVSVEAKTRNVKGVLGANEGNPKKFRIFKNSLKNAMDKNVSGSYVIFVDINHTYIPAKKGHDDLEKIRSEYKKMEEQYSNKMPNLVCFTNIPFHYGNDNVRPEANLMSLMIPRVPKFPLNPEVISAINESLKKYDFLPSEFSESDNYAEKILKS